MAKIKKTARDYKKIIKQAVQVDSSGISDIEYDNRSKVLTIAFKNGRTYEYEKVSPELHDALIHASSHGRFFNANILNNKAYPCKEIR